MFTTAGNTFATAITAGSAAGSAWPNAQLQQNITAAKMIRLLMSAGSKAHNSTRQLAVARDQPEICADAPVIRNTTESRSAGGELRAVAGEPALGRFKLGRVFR